MNYGEKDARNNPFAPLIAACVMGILIAFAAVGMQEGAARGYASIFMLFITIGLGLAGVIAGMVALVFGKFQLVFELIGSSIILPVSFLSILFLVGIINGEYTF